MSAPETEKTSILRFLRFTPVGLVKWLWLRITGREVVVDGKCVQCGRCCRQLNLSYGDRWIRNKKDFLRLKEESKEYDIFQHVGSSVSRLMIFECSRITEEGFCADHENRPAICREYPQPDLVFTGGELLDHCGYRFIEAKSFKKILARERKTISDDG